MGVQYKPGKMGKITAPLNDKNEIGIDGKLGDPTGEYGVKATRLWERQQIGDIHLNDPDMVAVCRMALRSCSTLTDEEIHIHRLLSTGDVAAIWGAVTGLPKAACVVIDSPVVPPGSTPTE